MLNKPQPSQASFRLGSLLAVVTFLLLSSLALSNVTEEGPAKRSLEHGVAILTEIDGLLGAEYAELRERAAATSGDERVALIDFPIDISFTPDEVLSRDQDEFRALLLERSSDQLYDNGASTLQTGSGGGPSLLSAEGLLRRGMDILRPTPHRVFFTTTVVLAVITAGLAVAIAIATGGYGRLSAISLSVLLGSAFFLTLSIGVRLLIGLANAATGDYLWNNLLDLYGQLTWAAIRNGLIFTGAAGVALAGSVTLRRSETARSF
jgi:hypothetical protein